MQAIFNFCKGRISYLIHFIIHKPDLIYGRIGPAKYLMGFGNG